MFKFLIFCSAVLAVAAQQNQTLGGCNIGQIMKEGKTIYNELPPTQMAQIKNLTAQAFAPNTTMTKSQYLSQLESIGQSLNSTLQAQIKQFVQTVVPEPPSNLSSAAQSTLSQIENVLTNMTITMPQNDAQIKQILSGVSPTVLTELKNADLFQNCQ